MTITIGQVLSNADATVNAISGTLENLPATIATAKDQLSQAAELRVVIPLAIFAIGLLTGHPILGALLAAALLLYTSSGS